MTGLQFLGNFMRIVFALIIALVGIPSAMVYAEIHTVSAVGEYTMSDYEEPKIAELRALDYARRSAAEQAGVYIKSYTKSKQMQISEDEVNAIASNKININAQKVSRQLDTAGNIRIRMEITATVDTADVDGVLAEEAQKRREGIKRYDEIKALSEEQDRQIAELKKKIATIPNDATAMEAEAREQQKRLDREFMSDQIMAEMGDYYTKAKLHEAIRINPKNYLAYHHLGFLYSIDGDAESDIKSSIKFYGMSLLINPYFTDSYIDRAWGYFPALANCYPAGSMLDGKCKKLARLNSEKAISIDPNNPKPYEHLGVMMSCSPAESNKKLSLTFFEKAFDLYERKISEYPNNASLYVERAGFYSHFVSLLYISCNPTVSNYDNNRFIEDICQAVRMDFSLYNQCLTCIDFLAINLIDAETADEYRAKLKAVLKQNKI